MKLDIYKLIIGLSIAGMLSSCGPESPQTTDTAYTLNVPSHFPKASIPSDNPLTVNKIRLGRMLFYDKRISEDQQVACANCHIQSFAFGSDKRLDKKVHGASTARNSSVLFNLAFTNKFFWDGRTNTLEATCLDAMKGEQNFNIDFVQSRLMTEQRYKDLFKIAFNTTTPSEEMVVKALASFIRTMISGGSRVDKGIKEGNFAKYLSQIEIEGKTIFETEGEGDCFHCHGDIVGQPLMTDNLFHNNGLDTTTSYTGFADLGLGKVTNNQVDNGKFKTGAIRNLSYTAPFMHDGRIPNLDGVLNHYNKGVKRSPTLDPNMDHTGKLGANLPPEKIFRLKAFLLALDDEDFIKDTSLSSPF